MIVSKNTVSELLNLYLMDKNINLENREKIRGSLFSSVEKHIKKQEDIKKKEEKREKERERKERKKAKLSHGTSCPRISTCDDELLAEF